MSIKQGNKTIAGDGTVSGVLVDNSLGHIFQSVDLTVHSGTQRCDGTIFTASKKLKEKFEEFTASGGMTTFSSNPENSRGIPFVSFTEYEAILTANVDAKGGKNCGFFGYNPETEEARTPTIAEGTVLAQAVMNGNLLQWMRDALPNIVGEVGAVGNVGATIFRDPSGSFGTKVAYHFSSSPGAPTNDLFNLTFDASKSNKLYGRDNEDELRPKAIRYPFLVVVDIFYSSVSSTSLDALVTATDALQQELTALKSKLLSGNVATLPDLKNPTVLTFDSSLTWTAPSDGMILFHGNNIGANLLDENDNVIQKEYWYSGGFTTTMSFIPKGYKIKYNSGPTQYANVRFYPSEDL